MQAIHIDFDGTTLNLTNPDGKILQITRQSPISKQELLTKLKRIKLTKQHFSQFNYYKRYIACHWREYNKQQRLHTELFNQLLRLIQVGSYKAVCNDAYVQRIQSIVTKLTDLTMPSSVIHHIQSIHKELSTQQS